MKKNLIFLTFAIFLFSSCDQIQNIKKERRKRVLNEMIRQIENSDKTVEEKATMLDLITKKLKKIEKSM